MIVINPTYLRNQIWYYEVVDRQSKKVKTKGYYKCSSSLSKGEVARLIKERLGI